MAASAMGTKKLEPRVERLLLLILGARRMQAAET